MVYLLNMVIFYSYVNVYQRVVELMMGPPTDGTSFPIIFEHPSSMGMGVPSLGGHRAINLTTNDDFRMGPPSYEMVYKPI